MSEMEMGMIERLAEIIMENMHFMDIKEVKTFCDELKVEVVGLYDPPYSEESSTSDSDDSIGDKEEIETVKDGNGFFKLK